jgi:MoxR-like ATPase
MPHLSIETFMKVANALPVEQSIMLRGDHGIGKSAIVRQIAKQLSENAGKPMPVIDIRISQMSDGDMIGLPAEHILENGSKATKFLPPEWYMLACTQPSVLFLDEFNRGSQEIMQACFQIVLDRCMNMVPLHPETRVFAAINLSNQYNVNTMDPALLDRLWVVDLNPDHTEWLSWARKSGISSDIVNFIAEQPVWLDPPKKSNVKEGAKGSAVYDPNEVHPSRRSWEMLDKALKSMSLPGSSTKEELDLTQAVAGGRIGTHASIAFTAFLKKQEKILGKDIVESYILVKGKGKKGEPVENDTMRKKFLQVTSVDQINAVVESTLQYISTACKWEEIDTRLSKNIETFFNDLPAEIFFAAYKELGKPREHIRLIAAINPTCGKRVAKMFQENQIKQ